MGSIMNFFKQIMMIKSDETSRVGLSQFNMTNPNTQNTANTASTSIRTKNVKLSDLMRRTNLL